MNRYFDRYLTARPVYVEEKVQAIKDIMVLFWDDITEAYSHAPWGRNLAYVEKWHYGEWKHFLKLVALGDKNLEELLTKEYRGGVWARALPFALKRAYGRCSAR